MNTNKPGSVIVTDAGRMLVMSNGVHFPVKHALIIQANWALGLPWDKCSPLYNADRKQIAEIVTAKIK
jgi:hypothetical protein